MTLAFFCLGGLELLGALDSEISDHNKKDWIEWIYAQQIVPSEDGQSKEVDHLKNRNQRSLFAFDCRWCSLWIPWFVMVRSILWLQQGKPVYSLLLYDIVTHFAGGHL